MEENSEISSIDTKSITEILTLRYDTTLTPKLPKLTWNDFVPTNELSLDKIENSITNSITNSINNLGDSKISLALSGGIDSTLVLALVRKKFPDIPIETISIKFADGTDESKIANNTAKHFNTHHSVVFLENFLQELPKAISITNRPFWDLHWYYVVKKASSFSKNLLSGDGGDELFGGYSFRYSKFLTIVSQNSTPLEKVQAYLQCHERDRVPDQEILFKKKMSFSWDSIHDILLPYFDNSLSLLDQVFLADYNGKLLFNFSPINSSLHNYFQMNSVTPILSNNLINYASHLPNHLKYDRENKIGKLPLRLLLKKLGIQKLVSTDKLGFSVNTLNLWKNTAQKICKYYLTDGRIVQDDFIDKNWLKQYIDKNDLDVKYVNKFLGLLAFEIWYRLFITNEMKSDEQLC